MDLETRVKRALDDLGPALAVDGGGVEFDRLEGAVVYVRLIGACIGCPGQDITLKYGVESAVRAAVPQVERVVLLVPGG